MKKLFSTLGKIDKFEFQWEDGYQSHELNSMWQRQNTTKNWGSSHAEYYPQIIIM